MPTYYVNPMLIGLILQDTPLDYTPPKGPAIDFQITYNQKDTDQPSTFTYGNLGPKWTYNWIEYVQDNPSSIGSTVSLYLPDGQDRTYNTYNSSTGAFAREPETGAILVLVSTNPVTYERRMPDGSKEVFSASDGSTGYPRKIYLTQRIDPQGNTVTLSYDSQHRLTGITDAVGQTSTLQYGNANPLLVTGLTDPFGRSAALTYDSSGRLSSITDAIGMTSSFGYTGTSTVVQSLTTPYGTTQFAYGEESGNYHYWLNITDANGHTSRWEFLQGATGVPYSETLVPTGMQTSNRYLYGRDSFYWDAVDYQLHAGDYTQAVMRHFNHLRNPAGGDYQLTSDSLESIKYPLENRIWFSHPDTYSGGVSGTLNAPVGVGRVLDDGSTQLTTHQYNSYGNLTQTVDATGLETDTIYASNDIDPIQIDRYGPNGYHTTEAFTYNSQHEPLTHTDEAGSTTTHTYNAAGQKTSETDALGHTEQWAYDANGYLTSFTDANGHATSYTYDNIGRLATETDPLGNTKTYSYDALNRITRITYWDGTYEENTWDKLDRVAHRDRNGNVTHYAYDGDRNLISITDPLGHVTSFTYYANNLLKTKTDSTGGVTTWTRDIEGRVTQRQDPNGGIWTFAYDFANRKVSETNPLGQTTSFLSYDGDNRLTRSKDLDGVITDLTYHPRGWLLTRTIRANADGSPSSSDATTTMGYDAVGDLTSVVEPDGVTTGYGYDAAHRLGAISDLDHDTITYTLDPVGNRTAENTYDPSGTLKRSLTRSFDARNEVQSQHDGEGDLTTFSYDANGNRVGQTDAFGVMTHWNYDAENRLLSTVQNYLGSDPATANTATAYGYDTANRLVSVTDPDNLATGYQVDAMGRVTQLTSPDTGVSTNVYDAAGNRTSHTDARGVTSTYTYDALNRVTSISYPTSTLDVHYYYDEPDSTTGCSGSYPIGRMTRMTDSSGSTTWCYDDRGNVVSKVQSLSTGGPAQTLSYTWNLANRLMGVTYPDGSTATYTRDVEGRIASVDTKAAKGTEAMAVSAIAYLPFGPASSYTFGNGETLTKTYDHAYRSTGVTSNTLYIQLGLDALGNPITLKDAATETTPVESYQYDPLYRLQQVNDSTGAPWQSYTYDKTGDRLTKTTAGQVPNQTYNYQAGTHRLIGITGSDASSRTMDANGNTTSIKLGTTTTNLTYDDRNRLAQLAVGGRSYGLNGLGQRVRKGIGTSSDSGGTGFVYDEGSRLLSEYGSLGSLRTDYVWADDTLVGELWGTPPGLRALRYIYTDGLGTPRALLAPGGTLWTWPYAQNPFGERPFSGSPGHYTMNMRFPGQYFDSETGLNYNMHRDYESGTGRYIESDPIGLNGGGSTYAYAQSAPLNRVDLLGLFQLVEGDNAVGSGLGGVFCDYFGNWRTYVDVPPPFDECPAIGICALVHEQSHIQDANRTNPGLCRWYKPLLGDSFLAPSSDDERKRTEFKAYSAELDCLKKFLKSLKCDNDKCKELIQEREEDIRDGYIPEVMNGTYGGY
jgi:RHS repeat-associated protein